MAFGSMFNAVVNAANGNKISKPISENIHNIHDDFLDSFEKYIHISHSIEEHNIKRLRVHAGTILDCIDIDNMATIATYVLANSELKGNDVLATMAGYVLYSTGYYTVPMGDLEEYLKFTIFEGMINRDLNSEVATEVTWTLLYILNVIGLLEHELKISDYGTVVKCYNNFTDVVYRFNVTTILQHPEMIHAFPNEWLGTETWDDIINRVINHVEDISHSLKI